jgi:glycosyltransferase involved in cell wall biosynthesis
MADAVADGRDRSLPLVSVIMPVYNGAAFLRESIRSILSQTYTRFEFIIINDGSKDNSDEIIRSFDDRRIRYHTQENAGLAATLNRGIGLSGGIYIARQDQDDISLPSRIQKQVDFLNSNPSVGLLGTRAKIIGTNAPGKAHNHAIHPWLLKFDLLFDNPFVHSSVMFRQAAISATGLYNTDPTCYEDFELWSRFAQTTEIANLPEPLLEYRHHGEGMSKSPSYSKSAAAFRQSRLNLETFLGRKDAAINDLAAYYHWHAEKLQGAGWNRILSVVSEIGTRLTGMYPRHSRAIRARTRQYQKVLEYRRFKYRIEESTNNNLKRFLLRIRRRIFGYMPHVTNK